MFWDRVAGVYNIFQNIYNGKVNKNLCIEVAKITEPSDCVLECACGTGMLTKAIASKCTEITATDFSEKMLLQTAKNCKSFNNVKIERADITKLQYPDNSYTKVLAGNVIHLLDNPCAALAELERVCRPNGKIIIPTYINKSGKGLSGLLIRVFNKFGAGFKRQFSYKTYRRFFAKAGYRNVEYRLIEGKMPCAIAIITNK